MKRKIITEHWKKPVPIRKYDWEAHREHYDLDDYIGYGSTEQEAIDDLIEVENN